jgi:L-proline amide hydrolase
MGVPGRGVEGAVPFRGAATWYRVVGDTGGGKAPVLCLHGGPGFAHDYLEPYEDLAGSGRSVIFYDQLGCGNSALAAAHDPSMWTVKLFVEEIDVLREALELDRVHLLGHSWGAMLAMEYALTQPTGLVSLVCHSGLASAPAYEAGARGLLEHLPPQVRDAIVRFETAADYGPAYEAAKLPFYQRHICRLDPWPKYVHRTLAKVRDNPEVYLTMWGPSEFTVVGSLKEWDITDRLSDITAPTLLISGRYDEIVPDVVRTLDEGIPNSEWVIFENSAHLCHAEERESCMTAVSDFLDRVEAAQSVQP